MTLREKLMHYTNDLDCGADLKQEAIATIEHIAQYMDEDELLHHSRPLALAYLALTEDASVPVVRCEDCKHLCVWNRKDMYAFCPKTNIAFLPFEQDTRTFFCGFGERKDEGNADENRAFEN